MRTLELDEAALALHERINRTRESYPEHLAVGELFARIAAERPQAIALRYRERELSYAQLNAQANRLAWQLLARGVQTGDVIAVVLPRSPELIVALLAILKAGASYLPIDPAWPEQRIHELFRQTACDCLVGDESARRDPRLSRYRQASLDEAGEDPGNPPLEVAADAIAYINFTSGSTGTPKGVPIPHRGITRLVCNARYARLDENSRLLQMAPVTFDAATFEIWGALLLGGTCVLYPDAFVRASRLQRVLQEQRISVLFLTTALFNTLVDEAPQALAGVDTVLTGGEAHSLRHMAKALALYGTERIVSVYGPTESTTFATFHPVRELREEDTALPIGLPIQNTRVYLVDGGRLCGPGQSGEVCLAGPGLSPGYLGLPESTRERFFECRIGERRERLYRTGDRCYFRTDDALVFQGRMDDQVKINGFRIELGEVAYHLNRHPQVRQSFVTVTEAAHGEKALVAFVVAAAPSCCPQRLRDDLAARLPGYMVPGRIQLCASLPLSATGKIDRRRLLATLQPSGEPAHEHQ
ncbi:MULTISPECIES: amino acid adenylation domain-containing protein [Pseudomonas aeruginosa group]|uniref:amino acid adenylation domain-containing protein n=1 Tax=Pseudomonas aeruginosa group TaxID=136841 RepID=UPI00071B6A6A|nr:MULTISPECIES: amino acid adenylation domain-containing protein [Pseudomonas aeruginosa group]KSC31634.1 peptide synthetase [Pseudomonas paraeruginosa]KSL07619.1 peptide synthetase [Pseudomonas aeruginosa]MBH8712407.1 amino acid adenylation domain-containing protein [Pseudomonas aeruginosa]MBH9344694.1 amino acid adenylation domain-containing protein [Pseudomonas aeruginosa]MBI8115368.1 amino acid adenylation domain-containing protein [Pseudomonas aeruginosa]